MPHRYPFAPELTDTYLDTVWSRLRPHLRTTFLLPSPALSDLCGCEVTLACETFQHTGSFKFRAAYNLVSETEKQQIITASSGNFGQAIAYACKLLKKKCIVVMPATSAQVKIEAVRSYGGQVDLIDTNRISRAERVAQLMEQYPHALQASAYDDFRVVAGNSTLGREILQAAPFDAILVPVGGGGLSSGLVVARDRLQATTEIIGAEPQPGDDAARSLRSGQLVKNEREPATIADGARTISLGELNWNILRHGIADIIPVPDASTLQALRTCFRTVNLKVEPTGALAIGALLQAKTRFAGKRVCCVVSGGNVDPTVYAKLLVEG